MWKIMRIGLVGLLASAPAFAGVTVHTTAAGDWHTPGTWVGSYVPQDTDTAIVDHNVTLTNTTALLAAFTVTTGKVVTFSTTNAIVNAAEVTVNGQITHNVNSATATNSSGQWVMDNWVGIICTNLTIATNGNISVVAKGFQSPNANANGYGPGGGTKTSAGGGYGGVGGAGPGPTAGGIVYGDPQAPGQPGSGGGSKSQYNWDKGGNGGGYVWIQAAGKVEINGYISATGGNATGTDAGGGGSGGGIWIVCATFSGSNGMVVADGGYSTVGQLGGGGGGGRISIQYDPVAQSNLAVKPVLMVFSANGAAGTSAAGRPGTVYCTDSSVFSSRFRGGQVLGFSSWTVPSLALSNSSAVAVFTNGFQLTVSNDLALVGLRSGLEMSNGTLTVGGSLRVTSNGTATLNGTMLTAAGITLSTTSTLYSYAQPMIVSTTAIGGDVTLTNWSKWYVYSAMTNGTASNGAVVTASGTVRITGSSWIYPQSHTTNGGSSVFRLKNLTVATNSGFDATARGFMAPLTAANGYGPGGGKITPGNSGAGYGGIGGAGNGGPAGGSTYGSSNAPCDPGSGGASRGVETWNRGGSGGGLVRLEVPEGLVNLDGQLLANGGNGSLNSGDYGGGGSGGGIYVLCKTFTGVNGILSATGGKGNTLNSGGGGGGGGRIAVWSKQNNSLGLSTNVTGGTGCNAGLIGTVVLGTWFAPRGTVITIW